MGDVSAKAESQLVVSELLGYIIGVSIFQIFGSGPLCLFGTFLFCAPLHILSTRFMLKSLKFNSLPQPRLLMLASYYVLSTLNNYTPFRGDVLKEISSQKMQFSENKLTEDDANDVADTKKFPNTLPGLEELAQQEKYFGEWFQFRQKLKIGISLPDAIQTEQKLRFLVDLHKNEKYILHRTESRISIVLHKDAHQEDVLRALFHAVYSSLHTREGPHFPQSLESFQQIHKQMHEWTNNHFEAFLDELELSGWNSDAVMYLDHGVRAVW